MSRIRRYESSGKLHLLVREYLRAGSVYMDLGKPDLAFLYLNRCAAIVDFERYETSLLDRKSQQECKDRLQALENEPLFVREIQSEIDQRADSLDTRLVRIWGLFSLCRLARVGSRLSRIRDCKPIGTIGKVAKFLYPPRQKRMKRREFRQLDNLIAWLEQWQQDFYYFDPLYVRGPCGPLQLFDLVGMDGIRSLYWFLEREYCNFDNELPEEEMYTEPGIIPVTLLPDYYLRNGQENLRAVPLLAEELERIRADYDFLRSDPVPSQIQSRLNQYVVMDILS